MMIERDRDPERDARHSSPAGDHHAWLETRLDEAVRAELERPPVDGDRFIARLRSRLVATPPRRRGLGIPALAAAALIPLAFALWWLFGSPTLRDGSTRGTEQVLAAESAIIEELDVLEMLALLAPPAEGDVDPELIELFLDLDLLEELPVETLGSTG